MSDVSKLTEIIGARLRHEKHRELLKMLVEACEAGGSEGIDAKIREILSEIEEA